MHPEEYAIYSAKSADRRYHDDLQNQLSIIVGVLGCYPLLD